MSSLCSDHACKYNSSLGRKELGLTVTKINAQEIQTGGVSDNENFVFKNCRPN